MTDTASSDTPENGGCETPEIVAVSRSQSVYHGGTLPNCVACDGKGWHEWPDGFAVRCPTCNGWGTK